MGGACEVCRRETAEGDDRFCGRCVSDYLLGESHHLECKCGPCAVHARIARAERYPSHLPEVMRERSRLAAESLTAYLARRDAPRPARLVVDVPGEEAAGFLHAVTTMASRESVRPGLCETERAAWVRLCSARLEP